MDVWLLPAVLRGTSWLAVMPSVALHSSSSFSSSPESGSEDWLRPLSHSAPLCPEQLSWTEELQQVDGLFEGLMVRGFSWETSARGVEVGGPPLLPKTACPLALLCTRVMVGSLLKLVEVTGGWGFQSRWGLDEEGVMLGSAFFSLMSGTGGGEVTGAAEEGWGEEGWRGLRAGTSLWGDTGGV